MSSRFEPGEADSDPRRSLLVDPEAYDASEQEFSASLEELSPRPRFVVKPEHAPWSSLRTHPSAPIVSRSRKSMHQTAKRPRPLRLIWPLRRFSRIFSEERDLRPGGTKWRQG